MTIFKKRKRERVRREIAEAIEGDPFFDEVKRHVKEYGGINREEFDNFKRNGYKREEDIGTVNEPNSKPPE